MMCHRIAPSTSRAVSGQRSVRVTAFKPVSTQGLVSALTAGSLLLAGPSFAVLPEGFSSPQGSNTASLEAKLDALIEQRTGKAEALPELTEVPQVKAEAPKPKKEAAPVVVAAPMAPAVAEPPAPVRAAVVAEPAAPAPAVVAAPEPPKGLQTRSEGPSAASAPAAPSNGLLIGGGVAVLGVVAAAALANNNGEGGAAAAPAAAASDASAAAPPAPEGAASEATAAAVGGAGESTSPSSKAE